MAWNCKHKDKLNYSMGLCQTCYLNDYHHRRVKAREAKGDESCESVSIASINQINEEINNEHDKNDKN